MWRQHPQADRLGELLAAGGRSADGRAQFRSRSTLEAAGDVRLSGELEGGALMDVGCYCVSAPRLIAGEPGRAPSRQGGDGVDRRFAGTLRFDGGVLAHFDCGVDTPDRAELEVVGSAGALLLGDPFHSREPVIEVRAADGSVERGAVESDNPYACELRDFAAATAGEREPRLGRADAVGQARAIAALYESAASGARVGLSTVR